MINFEVVNKLPNLYQIEEKKRYKISLKQTSVDDNYVQDYKNKLQKEKHINKIIINKRSIMNSLSNNKNLSHEINRDNNLKRKSISTNKSNILYPTKIKFIPKPNYNKIGEDRTPISTNRISFKAEDTKDNIIITNNKPKLNNIIKCFSHKTRAGSTFDGMTKINQDNFISKLNLLNLENYHIFGILDGHGTIYIKKEFMDTL